MLKKGVTRREFIKGAGRASLGALAFPYIVPATALGAEGAVAPSNRIVMGAIGVGGQGTGNMRRFLGDGSVQMVAVCDVDKSHREAARGIVNEKYGNQDCADYNDFRELLARDDIDAVCIGTPDHWHGLVCIAAAKAGKDMYCEKPLVNTIAEGRAVCNAVTRHGRVLQTGSHERSRHSVRFACELVRNGRIGKLHTMRVNLPWDGRDLSFPPQLMPVPEGFDYDMWLGPTPWAPYNEHRCHFFFRYILDYSGGEVTDRGAHIIDLGQLGNGTDHTGPVEVTGEGKFMRDGMFDVAEAYRFDFTYADGVRMLCASEWPRGIRFEGTDGWIFIHIHGGRLEADPPSLLDEKVGPDEIHVGRSPGHHEDFLNAVRIRRQPMAHAEIGHRTATMCHLANIAMVTGKRLEWDPVRECITNDEEANRMTARPMRSPWTLT